jgi:hypothetical protein
LVAQRALDIDGHTAALPEGTTCYTLLASTLWEGSERIG